ncbi:beta strand repeat-containing protein [Leptolyngbya iicbica]
MALLSSRTVTGNSGNGGNISLSAGRGVTGQGDIILNRPVRSGSQSFGGNAGNGGAVSFRTREGDIQLNNAGVFSDSASDDFQGGSAQAGGAISFSTTSGNIRLTNSPLSSESDAFDAGPQANTGPAGNVSLTTSTGNITLENSAIFAMNDAPNQSSPGGTVTIASTDGGNITLNNLSRIWSYSASRLGQAGDGGAVRLSTTTGNIRLSDRSFIDTASRSSESDAGNGGAISLSTTTGNIMLSGNSSLDSRASAFSFDAARNAGHGGNISITSESGDITIMDNASIDSQTSTNFAGGEFGEGGDITISSPAGTVTLGSGINLNSNAAGGEGNGGDIRVAGTTVQLTNNELSTTVGGSGTAGDITINASNQARITSSRLLSGRLASAEGSGGGGTIRITAADIELRDFSFLNTATFGFGDAGDVQLVTTQGDIVLIDSSIFSLAAQQGNPGNIRLDSAGQLRLEGNSLVSTAVALGVPNTSSSRSGNITINAANGVEIIGTGAINQPVQVSTNPNLVSINSTDRSTPQPLDEAFALLPNVQTAPNVLFPQDIPFVSVNSSSSISCCSTRHYYSIDIESVGTQIILDVDTPKTKIFGASEVIDELNLLDVDLSLQRFDGIGNFDTLIFTPVAENASAPTTLGAGGSTTSDDAYLTYIFDRPGTYVIEVISEFSNPFFSPFAEIDYTLNVSLVDDSLVSSGISTQTRSGIPSGDITINTPSITLQNGGEISAETLRDGPAGDITLQPFGSGQTLDIQLGDRSTISSSTLPSRAGTDGSLVTGNSGRISLSAPAALNLSGPGSIQVETNTAGDAGAIALTAPQITLNGIEVSASTEFPEGLTAAQQAALIANRTAGRGGDIDIRTSLLTLNNGSQIRAATASTATGGNLTVTGNSPLTIGGDGRLTVEATGANSGQAGNLNVRASELLRLRDGIELSANSESRQGGGNINIDVANGSLVMRGGSYINATSSNPNAGDGGNVTLTLSDGFLIALPGQNNDIIANAVRGRGGNINISALRLFGFTLQDDANVSRLRGNNTNDISASSEIGLPGDIAIDTLALDPSQGLTELPLNLEDRADQVTPGCGLGNTDDGSEFVVTGRGGLPPGASDPLMANGVSVPWVTATEGESTIAIAPTNSPVTNAVLIEAQGVALDAAGQPYLAATAEDWAIYQAGLPTATTCTVQPTRSH